MLQRFTAANICNHLFIGAHHQNNCIHKQTKRLYWDIKKASNKKNLLSFCRAAPRFLLWVCLMSYSMRSRNKRKQEPIQTVGASNSKFVLECQRIAASILKNATTFRAATPPPPALQARQLSYLWTPHVTLNTPALQSTRLIPAQIARQITVASAQHCGRECDESACACARQRQAPKVRFICPDTSRYRCTSLFLVHINKTWQR